MIRKTLTLILGLGLLAGCASKVTEWSEAESPKENTVQRSTLEHFVKYPMCAKTLPKEEKLALDYFVKDQLQNPDAIHIYVSEFGGHNQKVVDEIVRKLRLQGMRHGSLTIDPVETTPHYMGTGAALMVERFMVIPPSCEDWSFEMGGADGHRPMSNLRCADVTNLGMMVADPRDLLTGKDVGHYDGTRQALGVQMYREDNIKPLKLEDTSTIGAGGGAGG